jgi:hypothetical protein
VVFRGRTRQSATVSVNAALGVLGVRAQPPADAFGTLGLGTVRENPNTSTASPTSATNWASEGQVTAARSGTVAATCVRQPNSGD